MARCDRATATAEPLVHRLDRPPPAGTRADLAPAFGRRFVLFADAEEEFDWGRPLSRTETATSAIAALPDANRIFTAVGLVPTYLCDWPVIDNEASGAILARMAADGVCDIGAQLHPWVTPPHDEAVTPANSYAGNLPRALEAAKIARLTARIAERTGTAPLAYRAGRYGVGPHTAELLVDAGYRLDVSVRPLFDYSDDGGPDFRRHPRHCWWAADDLLAAPLSVALTGPLGRFGRGARGSVSAGILARTGLLQRVPLTPEGVPVGDALRAIRTLLAGGERLFSLSFHTPSLVPGHTPYVHDAADLKRFRAWWDAVFDLFAREGVAPARGCDVLAAARACQPPPASATATASTGRGL